jgi:hypothetical protein
MQAPSDNQRAEEWAEEFLISHGYAVQASFQTVRERPWSRVSRIGTSKGLVYLKQMIPAFAAEANLIQVVPKQFAGYVPKIIISNAGLDAFVMEDAGISLRERLNEKFQMEIPLYALKICGEIQRGMTGCADQLLAVGVPDWRLSKLTGLYISLIDQEEILIADGLSRAEVDSLHALQPRFTNLCDKLSAYGIPETIEHGDFHDNNILVKDDRVILSDWGDAALSHPFFSLATFLKRGLRDYSITPQDPRYGELKYAYLQGWMEFGPVDRLEEAFSLARRLNPVLFAISFSRIVQCTGVAGNSQYFGYLAQALRSFLQS